MQKKIWKILFLIFKIIPIFQNLKIQSIKITKKNKISFLTLSYQNRRFFFNISKFELILNFQISKVNILKSNRSKLQKKKKKYSYSFQKEIAKEKRSENINFNLEPPKWRSFFFFSYFANFASLFFRMIGAMPAVAVRHERKRQEKRLKRPSQLYLGGQWMPPPQGSPPTPSPHGHNSHLEPLPELYLCGKVKISRHMSQWPSPVVTILSISRYASWVCFVW